MKRDELERLADGPLYWLGGYARLYPNAWRDIEALRTQQQRDWPANIYAPISAVQPLVLPGVNVADLPWEDRLDAVTQATALTALAAWRMTKGVYRFDPMLQTALWDTPITGDIPVGVLRNLPEWCVYLALDGHSSPVGELRGAWVHLDLDPRDDRLELRMLVEADRLLPLVVRLGGGLLDGIRDLAGGAARAALLDWGPLRGGGDPAARLTDFVASIAAPIVNLTLYLCSAEPEIVGRGRPGNPRPVKVKGGQKLIAVQGVRQWDVGVVLGRALRAAQEREEREHATSTGRTVRLHVRRGHWHTYLTGPRHRERVPILKWLHPTLVGGSDVDALPVVVHPVK